MDRDRYAIKLYTRALRDLDEIYTYIANQLLVPEIAAGMIAAIEDAIFSLELLPRRGSLRTVGRYAQKGYRQLFVKNYVIIYRVHQSTKEVHVVTVRYAPSNF